MAKNVHGANFGCVQNVGQHFEADGVQTATSCTGQQAKKAMHQPGAKGCHRKEQVESNYIYMCILTARISHKWIFIGDTNYLHIIAVCVSE